MSRQLNRIELTEDRIRVVIELAIMTNYGEDPQKYEFDPTKGYGFESEVVLVTEALNKVVSEDKPNGGNYERIDYTFVADGDGVIQGYEFAYEPSVRSAVGAPFRDWSDIVPEKHGIDGLVELGETILMLVNAGIDGMNALYAGEGS